MLERKREDTSVTCTQHFEEATAEMNEPSRNDIEERIRQALDSRVGQLDTDTLSRLRQARYRALGQARPSPRKGNLAHIHWGTAVATAGLLLALGLTVWFRSGGSPDTPSPEELEMMANTETLLLYKDLDFYLWLQQRDKGVLSDPSSDHPKI